jgi:aromatic ring-opening dioxygenase LigB subunit
MIVFAGLVPNSPLLLPSVNRLHAAQVRRTTAALEEVAAELASVHPDVLVLAGEISGTFDQNFFVDFADPYHATFHDFGDLQTDAMYRPSFAFIDKLQRTARQRGLDLSLETGTSLPFTLGVPLHFLAAHGAPSLVPLSTAEGQGLKDHFALGQLVRDVAHDTGLRVAIVGTGHASHTASDLSPSGFHAAGPELAEKLEAIIATKNAAGLQQLSEDMRAAAQETCVRELSVVFGALDGTSHPLTVHSHEAPLGVSFIVASATLS